MPKRGAIRTALIALAALVVVVAGLGALTWGSGTSGLGRRVTSREGGVSVLVPRGWFAEDNHPIDPGHQEFLHGRENAALGLLRRGGFWVARWPASKTTTLDTLRADAPDNALTTRGRVGDYAAIVARYEQPRAADTLWLGHKRFVVRELIADGFVFQVGTWTLPRAGGVARELRGVAQSLVIARPQPWKTAHVTLPGGWVERETKIPGARLFALSPGDPVHAWAYVFHYADSPQATLRAARRKIPMHGGVLGEETSTTVGGRPATRLAFTFPDEGLPPANDVEWFVSDGHGGTFVLAVGRRAGDANVADRIAATWRF
ncbi:MAG: hypothetical protein QOK28_3785 [Actinomycetota bacterium]|jgi:hypothetical protein